MNWNDGSEDYDKIDQLQKDRELLTSFVREVVEGTTGTNDWKGSLADARQAISQRFAEISAELDKSDEHLSAYSSLLERIGHAIGADAQQYEALPAIVTQLQADYTEAVRLYRERDAQAAKYHTALQNIMQVLGPDVPTIAAGESREHWRSGYIGLSTEVQLALDALRSVGIEYKPRKRTGDAR